MKQAMNLLARAADPDPRIVALRNALPKMAPRQLEFAESLLRQANRLSEKQWEYVVKLAEDASKPRPALVNIGPSFLGVVELLDKASERLKWPKLLVRVNGHDYRLTKAGPTASKPGSINVTDTHKGDDRTWFGRVTRDGTFEPSHKLSKKEVTAITKTLKALAANPAAVAKAYGIETGACCFCGLELTDKRSIEAGYGPICADKWGLPWGQ